MLHIVNKSPQERPSLDSCLRIAEQGGSILLIAAVIVMYICAYVALSLSSRIKEVIGRTGDNILRRLFGVILAALSVQFVADGVRQIMAG